MAPAKSIKLMSFNYKIEYKKGKENRVADALSRIPQSWIAAIQVIISSGSHKSGHISKRWQVQTSPHQIECQSSAQPPFTLQRGIIR